MKERLIIMGTESIRAILDGTKSQTRRVIKPQPHAGVRRSPFVPSGLEDGHGRELRCPYGVPGDRLWVRETWQHCPKCSGVNWRACSNEGGTVCQHCDASLARWKPSIHMPKRLARIWLEAVSVWVERLQEISPDDIYAEGYPREMIGRTDPLLWFCDLWDSLNAKRGFGWSEDPWVWVVSFKEVI